MKKDLNINYIDSRSKINTLKVLSLGNENFKFYPTINSYTLTVDNTVENIEIKPELTDPKSTYVKGYGDRKVKLNVGENEILIKVQAENGHRDKDKWRRNCYSIISDDNTDVFGHGSVNIYGYNSFENDRVLHMFEGDALCGKF